MHPILNNWISKAIFFGNWLLLLILNFLVVHYYFDFELSVALIDSAVFNVTLAAICFSSWFWIKYGLQVKIDEGQFWLQQFLAGFLALVVWSVIGFSIVFVFIDSEEYISFLKKTLLFRWAYGEVLYLISVLIYIVITYYQDLRERLEKEKELELKAKDAELNFLKAQLNPHFLFNSLNSVAYLAMMDGDKAQDSVVKLSNYLRYALKNNEKNLVSITEEIGGVKLYLDIEEVRFGDKLKVNIEVEEGDLMLPIMILQPLIENAIKHGVEESSGNAYIDLILVHHSEFSEIKIANNVENLRPSEGFGIGLKNVKDRLFLTYGRNDLLQTIKADNKYCVTVRIPKS